MAIGRPDIDFTAEARTASRHPCFRVESAEKLRELQERIWEHYKRGGEGAPMECDEPGSLGSGEISFCLLCFFSGLAKKGWCLDVRKVDSVGEFANC